MREAIEKVISELKFLSAQWFDQYKEAKYDPGNLYDLGKSEAFDYATQRLKAVLDIETCDTRDTTKSERDDQREQAE